MVHRHSSAGSLGVFHTALFFFFEVCMCLFVYMSGWVHVRVVSNAVCKYSVLLMHLVCLFNTAILYIL